MEKFELMMSNIVMIILFVLVIKYVIRGGINGISGEVTNVVRIIASALVAPIFVPFVVFLLKKYTQVAAFIEDLSVINGQTISNINTASEKVNQAYARIVSVLNTNFTEVVLRLVAYILVCCVIGAALNIMFSVSSLADKIVLVGVADKVLGAVFGILKVYFICWGICTALMLVSNTALGLFIVNQLLKIPVFNYLYVYNPLLIFL